MITVTDATAPFDTVEAAFDYLATHAPGFTLGLEFHEPTNRPKVVLTLDDPEVRLAVDPITTDLNGATGDYVITSYEHSTHWLVVYTNDSDDRPGARIEEADATTQTFETTSMSFTRAIHRVAHIATTYTGEPTTANSTETDTGTDSNTDELPDSEATLHFDGASRGNPGAAATGYALTLTGSTVQEPVTDGSYLGTATCNEAEYRALREGLRTARKHGVTAIDIRGDSKLIINQVRGTWDCNNTDLNELRRDVLDLLEQFDSYTLEHVPREQNADADEAANTTLDNAA